MPDGKSVVFSITRDTLQTMVENYDAKVRGVDLAVDFAHRADEEAAGWITGLELVETPRECELWADVEWTPDGHAAVGGKKFRYISPDFAFSWTDNETGTKYGPTLFGAGLTNRPVIKNMATTVELTEVKEMAKKPAKKKISEMTAEELKVRLAEEKDEEKKELIELRLGEMEADEADGDDDGDEDEDDDGDEDAPAAKKKPKKKPEMNMDELKAAYQKVCDELGEVKKSLAKQLSETQKKEKEATFSKLVAEGKLVPAQKDAFMAGDTVKLAELAQPVKLKSVGADGEPVNADKNVSASDEVLKLAEKVSTERKIPKGDAISVVLAENPKLHERYQEEMEGTGAQAEA